ncbi:hypothetical protein [Saccharopolyspora rectivirgula]|uniref:Uncharacterized protein n=1 Tax=Saccharopolyspora rectivirgula TaxID=28042 RepID=A0A073B8N5_9PSEU|nr:hypothetical protein [Saccharopolyspora rectivirgula]KEI44084.1 hypothetical protein GU90_11425 [Saccharopolyspora rectivirgula]
MDLLVLMFLIGFTLATLVFWPLLQRASRRPENTSTRSAPTGKHALRPTARPQQAASELLERTKKATSEKGAQAGQDSASATSSTRIRVQLAEKTGSDRLAEKTGSDRQSENAAAESDFTALDIPELPANLFAKNFAAKFNRSRQRLNRIRTELDKL